MRPKSHEPFRRLPRYQKRAFCEPSKAIPKTVHAFKKQAVRQVLLDAVVAKDKKDREAVKRMAAEEQREEMVTVLGAPAPKRQAKKRAAPAKKTPAERRRQQRRRRRQQRRRRRQQRRRRPRVVGNARE